MIKKYSMLFVVTLLFVLAGTATYAANILTNSDFSNGSKPWDLYVGTGASATGSVVDGQYVVNVANGGTNKWDIQFRYQKILVQYGDTYTVSFKVRASKASKLYAKVGNAGAPYAEHWNNNWKPFDLPAGETVTVSQNFVMKNDTDYVADYTFFLGGDLVGEVPYTVTFDDVELSNEAFQPSPSPSPTPCPAVRVNQVGYLDKATKKATVVNSSTTPVKWELKNSSGTVVASGDTTVYGKDAASGDYVHNIDFSSFITPGTGYVLYADGKPSYTFDISSDIYKKMKYDALSYFYHNRSGIDITMPYAGEEKYTRPAGHKPDIATSGSGTQEYTIDATGGWYDAGDHGKYVVNGGISVWTLMNQYEHAVINKIANGPYVDGGMNIPENKNGFPDILDEARWEMDMMLNMQVPQGYPQAGMAVHKVHDDSWTGLGMFPHQDNRKRLYFGPSTAATLNLAATAAQSSRLWKTFDQVYAARSLAAAETAWDAAIANPNVLAPADVPGGGSYGDSKLTDEFYWAAAELYITTGKAKYLDYLKTSRHFLKMDGTLSPSIYTWGDVAGLGTVSLALVPNGLSQEEIATARKSITDAADKWVATQSKDGYMAPLAVTEYFWGSNSVVANMMMVMSYSYDFTGDTKYYNGIILSMDYLLGRNGLNTSYVTGYGEAAAQNPHHRFWAYQANPNFPKAPPGCLVGGPNLGMEDPEIKAALPPTTPAQKCYLDDINSWSSNEITINWNAPLAWVSAYLDEKNAGPQPTGYKVSGVVKPDFTFDASVAGIVKSGFNVQVVGTNTSANTDVNGSFTITNIPAGTYTIKISKAGYLGREIQGVVVTDGDIRISTEAAPINMWAGDMDKDNAISMADIMEIAKSFNSIAGSENYAADSDFNKDNAVNIVDIMIAAKHFGAVAQKF